MRTIGWLGITSVVIGFLLVVIRIARPEGLSLAAAASAMDSLSGSLPVCRTASGLVDHEVQRQPHSGWRTGSECADRGAPAE